MATSGTVTAPVRSGCASPGRPAELVLDAGHVRRTLTESPDPFAPDSWEKRGALRHLQPHSVLISHGSLRAERRVFDEAVLDTGKPLHEQAGAMTRVVHGEASWLGSVAAGDGALTWDTFIPAWWRTVRRVVLGDDAREDHRLTDDLTHLRNRANWSGLVPQQKARRDRFRNAVRTHLDRAEPGSLATMTARNPADGRTDPVDQVRRPLPPGAVAGRQRAGGLVPGAVQRGTGGLPGTRARPVHREHVPRGAAPGPGPGPARRAVGR
jgi:hypothetical protein